METQKERKQYVCGFCFDYSREKVVLIKKNRPEWQKGKLNGVGGKIEAGETIHDAMQREFLEETGVDVWAWNLFCTYNGRDGVVYFMKAFSAGAEHVTSVTDEVVNLYDIRFLNNTDPKWAENETIPNLKWLIPLAKDILMDKTIAAEYTDD